jgi:hypothetical protein
MKNVPAAMLVQNAVARSTSESSLRCTIAAPSARSEKTRASVEKTITMLARPKSRGDSSRASRTATIMRPNWPTICDVAFQNRPPSTSRRIGPA